LVRLIVLAFVSFLAVSSAAQAGWAVGLAASSAGQSIGGSAPATPTGATSACTSPVGSTVKVTWNPVVHATSYTIWKSTTSATSGYTVAATGVTGTSWTSGSLALGSYWFEVSAAIGNNWTSPNSTATAQRTILVTACT